MSIGSFFDHRKVAGLLMPTEYKALWLKARYVQDPSVCLELSFDDPGGARMLPGTRISYIGIWRGKATLCEFQLGVMTKVPSEADFAMYLNPVIVRLANYRPIFVAR